MPREAASRSALESHAAMLERRADRRVRFRHLRVSTRLAEREGREGRRLFDKLAKGARSLSRGGQKKAPDSLHIRFFYPSQRLKYRIGSRQRRTRSGNLANNSPGMVGMSLTLAIGSRRRFAPTSKATCNDSAKFSTPTLIARTGER